MAKKQPSGGGPISKVINNLRGRTTPETTGVRPISNIKPSGPKAARKVNKDNQTTDSNNP